ncbi:MAG: RNHCP domain-containing protein [Spirochaetales bacterium]|nr:RNHCP domain-containing protein [Spirochaetales bacterium]
MSRTQLLHDNQSFLCGHCGHGVSPLAYGGSQRNHCPQCLYSRHVDIRPGDRRSACKGMMKPISIWIQDNGEWSVIHRCSKCGALKTNRIAADDNELLLFSLAASFLSQLPFPGHRILGHMQNYSQHFCMDKAQDAV